MMLCYSKTRKIKYFLDPPPKKRLKDTNGGDMSTRISVFSIQSARDLDIHLVEIQQFE